MDLGICLECGESCPNRARCIPCCSRLVTEWKAAKMARKPARVRTKKLINHTVRRPTGKVPAAVPHPSA